MMNKKFLPPEDRQLADHLESLAQSMTPDAKFERELEKRLMNTNSPAPKAKGFFAQALPALGWAVGLILLTVALNMAIRSLGPQPAAGNTPTPETAPNETLPTPKPAGEVYDRYGQTVYMQAQLPALPAEAFVYDYQPEQFATLESARALATQFGLNGAIYQSPGDNPNTTSFLIVDGSQRLRIRSDQYFQFYPDYPRYISIINGATPPANAEAVIDEFLTTHGFDFAYEILPSEMYGGLVAAPLTPDGHILCYEYFQCAGLRFTLDEQGILLVDGALPKYETLGQYGIISAEEAFQLFINPEAVSAVTGATGTMEGVHSYSPPIQTWLRPRPNDQTITIFGWMSSIPSLDGGAPLVTLDGFTVTGNTADIAPSLENTFVEATGQIHNQNGVQTFELEAWKTCENCEDGVLGTIDRQGEQVILTTIDNETLILLDISSDLPLPLADAFVIGVRVGETYEWKSIDMRNISGGGGGGGGSGFYKLNLTGTPVPFPTIGPAPQFGGGGGGGGGGGTTVVTQVYAVQAGDTINSIAAANGITPEELMQANDMTDPSTLTVGQTLIIPSQISSLPQKVEELRGFLSITIYNQSDGSQRVEYGFVTNANPFPYLLLEGDNLEELQAYQNRPVDVWGTVELQNDQPVLKVDRYEIPYPNLQFQILRGHQRNITLENQPATLFTADDGTTYVQFAPGGVLDGSTVGYEGDEVLIEALVIPDETFGGYPVVRLYSASMAVNPKNGQAAELQISADQIYVVDEASEGETIQPTLTIERVELVYYMPDPRYLTGELSPDQRYLQPAWLFTGHYSDGSEFFFIVQALQLEFLLPEAAPFTQPG